MGYGRKCNKKNDYRDDSSSSSSSSSSRPKRRHNKYESESSETSVEYKKHHRNKECKKEKKGEKRCRKYSESSSSEDSSESESSESKRCSDKEDLHSSNSSSNNLDCNFDELYKYYKYRLLHDDGLMVGGSSAYINAVNPDLSMIPRAYGPKFSTTTLNKNVEHIYPDAPFFVREDGVYIVFFIATDDNASQWTFFVNDIEQPLTTVGTNSGAGQIIVRSMIALKKNDNVLIRNYMSNPIIVNTAQNAGGVLVGNDLTFLLMKIAPLHPVCPREMPHEDKKYFKKHLYKRLSERLVCDNELMMKGFNVYGNFYTKMTQSLVAEQDVVFTDSTEYNGIMHNPTGANPEQLKILEDGVYKLFFIINTTTPCQFAFAVNGVAIENTVQGTNRGAGQLTIRTLLELKKNDVITVRNHISNNATIVTSENSGGKKTAIANLITIFKIAPLSMCNINVDDCKVSEHYKHCYETFRNYLLLNKHLQIAGSPSYASLTAKVHQELPVNASINWGTLGVDRQIAYLPGTSTVTVEKNGVYDLFVDLITDETSQFTLFVNGMPVTSSTSGRESGANRCVMRQFLKLYCGDVLSVRNWESNPGTVNLSVNPGGSQPGNSAQFMLFLLSNCKDKTPLPPPPTKKIDMKNVKKL